MSRRRCLTVGGDRPALTLMERPTTGHPDIPCHPLMSCDTGGHDDRPALYLPMPVPLDRHGGPHLSTVRPRIASAPRRMTATIHGLTLCIAGEVTHRRRYTGGKAWWHCSMTDGPCQGHAKPAAPAPAAPPAHRPSDGAKCSLGHTDTYYRWQASDGRWHLRCRPCGNKRKAESRASFNNRMPRRVA